MHLQDVLDRLHGVRKSGAGFVARCPAHDDHDPSLSITQGRDARAVLHCFAGCSYEAIASALALPQATNGNLINRLETGARRRLVATYDYTDEAGALLYQKLRYEPKEFRQRRPDAARGDGWTWKLGDVRRVLYRLPELVVAEGRSTVFLVEGEKDADRLSALGLVATTNAEGAANGKDAARKWRPEYTETLRARHVSILPDNDEAGAMHAAIMARALHGTAASVKIVGLPDLPPKGDVSDYLDRGGTVEEIERLVTEAAEWQPTNVNKASASDQQTPALRVVCIKDVEAETIKWLWHPYIALRKLTILEGEEGIGKSFLTCALASAVSHGRGLPFVDASSHIAASNALLMSAEDGVADTLRPRLESVGAELSRVFAVSERLTLDAYGLSRLEEAIIEYAPALVIIDPLFAYTGGKMDIHRSNELREISTPLADIAQHHGCALVVVRHIGKSRGDGDPRRAGLGGIDLRAAARSVLLAGTDPDDKRRRAVVQTKNNFAPFGDGIGFTIDDGVFLWTGASDLTATRILSAVANDDERSAMNEAVAFLRAALGEGARPAKEVKTEAMHAGLTEQNLRTARARLQVKVFKEGGRIGNQQQRWMWQIPKTEDVEVADSKPEDVKQDENQHLLASNDDKDTYHNGLAEDVDSHVANIFCASEIISAPLTDEEAELAAQLEYYGASRMEADATAHRMFQDVPF